MEKNKKNDVKNKVDFKTNARERIPRSGPVCHAETIVVWSGIGPGAPRNSRPVYPNDNRAQRMKGRFEK